MNDPHDRFAEWLSAGAGGEPARDVALHASFCPDCLRLAAALDALATVDPGAVDLPAGVAPLPRTLDGGVLARRAAGVAAVGLVGVAAVIGGASLLDRADAPAIGAAPTSTPFREGVLGGEGAPSSASSEPTRSANPSESMEPSPSATDARPVPAGTVTPPPQATVTPRPPVIIIPPAGTPRPTVAPIATLTPRPSVAVTPAPTAAPTATPPPPTPPPTPAPTPTPTPEPTPTPTP